MNNLPLVNTKEKYVYINFAFDCGKLTINEYAMYNALIRNCNENYGYAYPSYEHLMKHLNITSRNTLNKYIKALEEKGFIIKVKGTQGQNNRYYFVHPNNIDVSQIELKEKDTTKTERLNKNTSVSQYDTTSVSQHETTIVSQHDTVKEYIKEYIKENNKENIMSSNDDKNEIKHEKKLFDDTFKKYLKECDSFTNVQESCTLKENINDNVKIDIFEIYDDDDIFSTKIIY